MQQAVKAEINLLPIMLKRLTLTGSTLRARDDAFKVAIAKQLAQQVWPLFNSGHIKPIIDKVFILEEAAQAHDYMESSRHIGKIILKV
ncbi:zinc-binding dehydrogenase [Methylocucumis oryzae]|uniref:zinc-binding dehydrogenase n=1 Tax=Methylocucumis oryzae TaxID=1632867 RepID=UPI000A9141B9